ncbi:MAG: TRAP transporter large permease subunit [Dehalococcoidales bacterium]|nr:TRAP transporter large permease subunit [Dehalococcoidales bacterium]
MSLTLVAGIGVIVGFLLVYFGMPVAFAFGLIGFFGVVYIKGFEAGFGAIATIPYGVLTRYAFTVIPMFTLMGFLAFESRFAEEFYRGIRGWLGHTRGGMASAVIVGNAAFGACTGDSISAACTFAAMSLPEMRKYKYSDMLSLGSITSGSLLAQLIPPSMGLIIFGLLTETPVGKLFIAGIIPGMLLMVLYILTIYIMCRLKPNLGPAGPKLPWKERIKATPGMWSLIIIIGVILGGLYLGIFTPTEAAAVSVLVVTILALIRKRLSWQGVKRAFEQTGATACLVFFLVIGCMVFNLFIALTGAHLIFGQFVASVSNSPTVVLIVITVIYILLGTIFDMLSITILTLPIFFPITIALGIDPIHFGVIQVTSGILGSLTPPFGIIVFALSSFVKEVPLYTIFRSTYPFLVTQIVFVLLLIFFPQISLFLTNTMK